VTRVCDDLIFHVLFNFNRVLFFLHFLGHTRTRAGHNSQAATLLLGSWRTAVSTRLATVGRDSVVADLCEVEIVASDALVEAVDVVERCLEVRRCIVRRRDEDVVLAAVVHRLHEVNNADESLLDLTAQLESERKLFLRGPSVCVGA
jgi:hypothetical protein